MPSARPSQFTDPAALSRDEDGARVFDPPTGLTTRDTPPASPGLRAPAAVAPRVEQQRAAVHPAKRGRKSDEDREVFVSEVVELMDSLTASEIAIQTGAGSDGRSVREVIRSAKSALQSRAEFYVKAHALATIRAAAEGDAKPAQWALEHISEGADRVVEPEAVAPPAAPPTFQVGFILGGIPQPAIPVQAIDVTPKP